MDWTRLRSQIDEAWRLSGRSQKEVLARANIKARQSIAHWSGGRNLPELENLAAYAKASEAQLIIELFPRGTPGLMIATTEQGADAARIIEALPSPEVGRNPRELVLRFLRVAHAIDDRGWDSLDLIVHHAEVAIAAAAARKEG